MALMERHDQPLPQVRCEPTWVPTWARFGEDEDAREEERREAAQEREAGRRAATVAPETRLAWNRLRRLVR